MFSDKAVEANLSNHCSYKSSLSFCCQVTKLYWYRSRKVQTLVHNSVPLSAGHVLQTFDVKCMNAQSSVTKIVSGGIDFFPK